MLAVTGTVEQKIKSTFRNLPTDENVMRKTKTSVVRRIAQNVVTLMKTNEQTN